MRRFLVTTLAVPALLLAACSTDDEPSVEESAAQSSTEATEDAAPQTAEAEAEQTSQEPTDEPTADAAATTEEAANTGAPEGGAEGEAAAEVTKQFMVALANADPDICDLLLDFTGDGPMSESKENMDLCTEILPSTLEGMITEEQASIIESIEVNGAEVDGDSATVDKDNFSELFAEGFGDESIALRKFDGTWYVDLDNSFQGATGG